MKNINIHNRLYSFLLGFFALIILFSSCDDRWEAMNTNPNSLTDIPDEYLFTSSVRQTFRNPIGIINVDYCGQYAHVFTGDAWHREIDKYNSFDSQSDYPEQVFRNLFQGPIKTSYEVMVLTETGGLYENEMRYAQADIINVINFALITDLFGDVPYFEGGKAKYGFHKPAYDTQEEIYADLVARLGVSIGVLKTGNDEDAYPPGIDPIYDGDVSKWIRFANSFRLRLAVRARLADQTKYEGVISECLAEDLIEDNTQNATLMNWESDNSELYNPWHNNIINYSGGIYAMLFSEFFIELLKADNDPRLPFYATKNSDDEYIGMPNGMTDSHQTLPSYATWNKSNTSHPSAEFFAKDQPLYLITAGEVWLLKSELLLNGIGSGDANTMYQTGIDMSMQQWGIDPADISTFLSTEAEATLNGTSDNQIRQVATQLYINYVPNTVESWSTVRRLGYPTIAQRTADNFARGVTDGYMPTRLNYPSTIELSVNGENLQEAIDRLGGEDKIDLPVWWDVN